MTEQASDRALESLPGWTNLSSVGPIRSATPARVPRFVRSGNRDLDARSATAKQDSLADAAYAGSATRREEPELARVRVRIAGAHRESHRTPRLRHRRPPAIKRVCEQPLVRWWIAYCDRSRTVADTPREQQPRREVPPRRQTRSLASEHSQLQARPPIPDPASSLTEGYAPSVRAVCSEEG
jgi:hypothetical protein